MPDAFAPIQDACREADIQTRVLRAGDGELLVTLDNARILGCRSVGGDGDAASDNFFYSPAGTVSGGDRLWIAPEVAYFWPSLEKAREDPVKHAIVPPQIDPGGYRLIDAQDDSVRVQATMELVDHRVGKRIALEAERWFEVIPGADLPDAVEREARDAGVRSVNFGITNRLRLHDGDPDAVAGAWDILQVPRGGTLICPVTEPADPTSYYDPWSDTQVRCTDGAVYFHADGKSRIKMGLKPEITTGEMGYYLPGGEASGGGNATLIVRLFVPNPAQEYVDLPIATDPTTRTGGDCLQAYCDDDTYGPFAEMEHHAPGIVVAQSAGEVIDKCSTHCFTGPDAAIRKIAEELLGVPVDPTG